MLDEDKPRLASILQPHGHSAGKHFYYIILIFIFKFISIEKQNHVQFLEN